MNLLTEFISCAVILTATVISLSYKDIMLQKVNRDNATLWNLGPMVSYPARDRRECVMKCLDNNCLALSYDDVNANCILGTCAVVQDSAPLALGDIFQAKQSRCNDTPGFEIETNGNITTCLWWSTLYKPFAVAINDCLAKGAILATFKTLEKFQILQRKNWTYYIGLDDTLEEGVFRWHDDNSTLSNANLNKIFDISKGQPNNYNGVEDCVMYAGYKYNYLLNDCSCLENFNYVCEKPCFS